MLIARAADAIGGRVALLPSGEARVEKVDEHTVSVNGASKHVTCYAVYGPALRPAYVWLEDDGTLFGNLSTYRSGVREGWESTLDVLIARQATIEVARLGVIAKKHAHRSPAAGLAYTHGRVLDVAKTELSCACLTSQRDNASAIVALCTVGSSACSSPARFSSPRIAMMPPARCTSSM
jgi:hypothetical protein